jgi:hypothetical protein
MNKSNASHEDFSRATPVTGSSDRGFGLVMAGFLALVAFAPLLHHRGVRFEALIPAVIFLAIAIAVPGWLAPLNFLWFRLGLLLHRIVSPLMMAVIFYLVVTPTALIMRWRGKDPLHRRFDRAASSYWLLREPPGPPGGSMSNQF